MMEGFHPFASALYLTILAAALIVGVVGRRRLNWPGRGSRPGEMARLEGHLRQAVLDPAARERLVRDAMRVTGGDRMAALRKVLADIERDNDRYR